MKTKILSILLICCMLVGCTNQAVNAMSTNKKERTVQISDKNISEEMTVGNVYHGFTLKDIYASNLLNSDIYTFKHEGCGADLVYIKNSDPECAFSITYKTPYIDETDTNHVFEHAILAGSEKYPAKDLFFDLYNKSYSTFINAVTLPLVTMYPVASLDQNQLIKLMDAYMSCMVAPDILKNENIFKREAIRFELNNPDEDISINGTVYAEDLGYLTDPKQNVRSNILHELYPGEIASNLEGMGEFHYDDLTYEHTLETYERYYYFDNSLITLYGDLNIDTFLDFLDSEYLSKYEVNGTDLSKYTDPPTEGGYIEKVLPIIAYEGDSVENSGFITYSIDLQGADIETLHAWTILCSILNRPSSVMNKKLIAEGIENPVSVEYDTDNVKPFVTFKMSNANADQMQALKKIAEFTLKDIAENGVSSTLLDAVLKDTELSTVFARNSSNVAVYQAIKLSNYWAANLKTDYYATFEDTLFKIKADTKQDFIKSLAKSALEPKRSALIASIPEPGTAEKYEEELASYLKKMKDSMSDEEIAAFIKETEAFNEWNEIELPNNDFMIDPKDIPDTLPISLTKETRDDITFISGDVDAQGAACYSIYFDLSGMSRDELMDLMAYNNLFLNTDTSKYSAEELDILKCEFLYEFSSTLCYLHDNNAQKDYPALLLTWEGLTKDFEKSLNLLLNILTETDLSDTDDIAYIISKNVEKYNMSKKEGYDLSKQFSMASAGLPVSDSTRLLLDVSGSDLYTYMKTAAEDVKSTDGSFDKLLQKFDNARKKAYTKSNLIFGLAASKSEQDEIIEKAFEKLSLLDEKDEETAAYELPSLKRKTGVIAETTQNYTALYSSYKNNKNFRGAYIPFIYAANDKYIVPKIRFQYGAYSAGLCSFEIYNTLFCYSYMDPNVKKSIEVFEGISDYVKDAELTEEEFKGYILTAYGNANLKEGLWTDVNHAILLSLMGADEHEISDTINDIKNASLSMQSEAATSLEEIIDHAGIATAGNEKDIMADKNVFDEIINLKEK